MENNKTFEDLLEELAVNVKETLNGKISADWTWGDEYHIYRDTGWLKNHIWRKYVVVVSPQLDFDSGNIKSVSVDVYTPKVLNIIEQTFEKYREENSYVRFTVTKHFGKSAPPQRCAARKNKLKA